MSQLRSGSGRPAASPQAFTSRQNTCCTSKEPLLAMTTARDRTAPTHLDPEVSPDFRQNPLRQ